MVLRGGQSLVRRAATGRTGTTLSVEAPEVTGVPPIMLKDGALRSYAL